MIYAARLENAPCFPDVIASPLAWQSHKIAGWMKRGASTEYSSNGVTATLVPP
ncbi:MAG: hypothetical protein ABSD50_04450 [Smithella sp.]|jgi:hypothetical protein